MRAPVVVEVLSLVRWLKMIRVDAGRALTGMVQWKLGKFTVSQCVTQTMGSPTDVSVGEPTVSGEVSRASPHPTAVLRYHVVLALNEWGFAATAALFGREGGNPLRWILS